MGPAVGAVAALVTVAPGDGLRETPVPVEESFVVCAAGDDGASVGAVGNGVVSACSAGRVVAVAGDPGWAAQPTRISTTSTRNATRRSKQAVRLAGRLRRDMHWPRNRRFRWRESPYAECIISLEAFFRRSMPSELFRRNMPQFLEDSTSNPRHRLGLGLATEGVEHRGNVRVCGISALELSQHVVGGVT